RGHPVRARRAGGRARRLARGGAVRLAELRDERGHLRRGGDPVPAHGLARAPGPAPRVPAGGPRAARGARPHVRDRDVPGELVVRRDPGRASRGAYGAGGRVPGGREKAAGRAPCAAAGRRGFTLVEALVALVLSSVLLMLVSGTFLAQNRHQARQALTAGVHDDVRAATALVARELRRPVEDGILVAGPRTRRVRAPAVVATVCARSNFVLLFWASIHVHSEEGRAGIRPSEVSGVSLRSGSGWDHEPLSWSDVD